ncbi:hypothetical protein GCM10020254_09580 [Streptomyces goshikiensis]
MRAVRAEVPFPFPAVGPAAAVQPGHVRRVRPESEPAQVVLHEPALGQPHGRRIHSALGAHQPVAEHVVVDLEVRRDVHPQPFPRAVQPALPSDPVTAPVVVTQQV